MNDRRALNALRQCERDLKQVLQQAAEKGAYDEVLRVGRWGRDVAALAVEAEEAVSATAIAGKAAKVEAEVSPSGLSQPIGAGRPVKHKQPSGLGYPRFARLDDQLIKIGWSKKRKKEYQHKSPKHVSELLCEALLHRKADSQTISTDRLFPLHNKDGSAVPDYQAYLCLAWFKVEEVVVQEGRQGYRVPDRKGLTEILPARWEALPHI